MHAQQMIRTRPQSRGGPDDLLIRCIESCFDCEQSCIACAEACLSEGMVQESTLCIRLNLDCADACQAGASVATRRTGSNESTLRALLQACELACCACIGECVRHLQKHKYWGGASVQDDHASEQGLC